MTPEDTVDAPLTRHLVTAGAIGLGVVAVVLLVGFGPERAVGALIWLPVMAIPLFVPTVPVLLLEATGALPRVPRGLVFVVVAALIWAAGPFLVGGDLVVQFFLIGLVVGLVQLLLAWGVGRSARRTESSRRWRDTAGPVTDRYRT